MCVITQWNLLVFNAQLHILMLSFAGVYSLMCITVRLLYARVSQGQNNSQNLNQQDLRHKKTPQNPWIPEIIPELWVQWQENCGLLLNFFNLG